MIDFIVAIVVVPVLVLFWVTIQHLSRLYSLRHPELGAHREEGSGCGGCGCGAGQCRKK